MLCLNYTTRPSDYHLGNFTQTNLKSKCMWGDDPLQPSQITWRGSYHNFCGVFAQTEDPGTWRDPAQLSNWKHDKFIKRNTTALSSWCSIQHSRVGAARGSQCCFLCSSRHCQHPSEPCGPCSVSLYQLLWFTKGYSYDSVCMEQEKSSLIMRNTFFFMEVIQCPQGHSLPSVFTSMGVEKNIPFAGAVLVPRAADVQPLNIPRSDAGHLPALNCQAAFMCCVALTIPADLAGRGAPWPREPWAHSCS